MRKTHRKHALLAASLAAFVPAVTSQASTLTLALDSSAIAVSPDGITFTAATLIAGTITLTPGEYFEFGVTGNVTGNANAGPATISGKTQPTNLGLGSYGVRVTTSNVAIIAPVDAGGGNSTASPDNTPFGWSVADNGSVTTGTGLVGFPRPISGGILAAIVVDNDNNFNAGPNNSQRLTYAATTAASLFTGLQYRAGTTGTAVITPLSSAVGDNSFVRWNPAFSQISKEYTNVTATGTDTFANPGTITVVVASAGPTGPSLSITQVGSAQSPGLGTLITTGSNGSYQTTSGTFISGAYNGGTASGVPAWVDGAANNTDANLGNDIVGSVRIDSNGSGGLLTGNTNGSPILILMDLKGTNVNIGIALSALISEGYTVDTDGAVTGDGVTNGNTSLFDSLRTYYGGNTPNSSYDALVELTAPVAGTVTPGNLYVNFNFLPGENVSVARLVAVPEPTGLALLALATVPVLTRRRNRKA